MNILLGSFAGTFANLLKYLTWCLVKNENDHIYFIYMNKYDNDNHKVIPFSNLRLEEHKNIFYKLFLFPEGHTHEELLSTATIEMNFPNFLTTYMYKAYNLKPFPDSFDLYKDNFIFNYNIFKDPNINQYRKIYNTLWNQYLIPTEYLQKKIDNELAQIKELRKGGKKILSVFIRSVAHYSSYQPYNAMNIFSEIDEKMKDYDYLLPITQVDCYYDYFVNRYPNIIKTERDRRPMNSDWNKVGISDEQLEKEVLMCIIDVYMGSQCDMVCGSASNMFYGCLIINPTIQYCVFKELELMHGD